MDEFGKFYNKALKFLSYRPRSVEEVRKNLLKLLDIDLQKEVALYLIAVGKI